MLQFEAWAGNRSVSLRRVDNGFVGTLTNLHKGVGMPVAWILPVDTLVGSMILLSISGALLWLTRQRQRQRREGLILATSALVIVGLALSRR